MTPVLLAAIGTWIFSDAVYSYCLYAHSQSWRGDRQNWARDHWVRAVRGGLGVVLFVLALKGEMANGF